MVYSYNEKNEKIELIKMPILSNKDAKNVEDAKVPVSFLKNVMKLKLNIVSNTQ